MPVEVERGAYKKWKRLLDLWKQAGHQQFTDAELSLMWHAVRRHSKLEGLPAGDNAFLGESPGCRFQKAYDGFFKPAVAGAAIDGGAPGPPDQRVVADQTKWFGDRIIRAK